MSYDPTLIEGQFSIHGASALFRKQRLMRKVAERIVTIDKNRAYRMGIGPLEYDAILESRLSALTLTRLETIFAQFATEPG